jgi:replication factor C subunit 3/5
MDKLPWIEKYRPQTIDDIIAHEEIIYTINKFIDSDMLPHLLFYGPPGTGKTSTILACAKKMYGNHYSPMVIHLNASDERGIDVVRCRIKDFATTRSIFGMNKVKLVILDEADSMTEDAQLALRQIIVNCTYNTRFCLICNYIGKIIPSLQSRFTKFRFCPLKKEQIIPKIKNIIDKEHLKYTDEGLSAIYELSNGDMRRYLNMLQSIYLSYNEINLENIHKITGKPQIKDIYKLINVLLNSTYTESYLYLEKTINNGLSLLDIISYLQTYISKLPLNNKSLCYIYENLSNIEFNCSENTKNNFQLSGIVGIFIIARNMIQ